jgi:hypothetical protein
MRLRFLTLPAFFVLSSAAIFAASSPFNLRIAPEAVPKAAEFSPIDGVRF